MQSRTIVSQKGDEIAPPHGPQAPSLPARQTTQRAHLAARDGFSKSARGLKTIRCGLRANRHTRRGLRAAVTGTDPLWRSVLRIARVPYRRALSGAACKTGPKARGRQPRGADANTRKQWRRAADHFLGDLFSAGLSATRGWRSKTSPKPPVVAGFAAAVSCSNQSRH